MSYWGSEPLDSHAPRDTGLKWEVGALYHAMEGGCTVPCNGQQVIRKCPEIHLTPP